jgi:hypothetical protein
LAVTPESPCIMDMENIYNFLSLLANVVIHFATHSNGVSILHLYVLGSMYQVCVSDNLLRHKYKHFFSVSVILVPAENTRKVAFTIDQLPLQHSIDTEGGTVCSMNGGI